jgi:hypothetical protein
LEGFNVTTTPPTLTTSTTRNLSKYKVWNYIIYWWSQLEIFFVTFGPKTIAEIQHRVQFKFLKSLYHFREGMATFVDGELTRTWNYVDNNRVHVINLSHDTLTGVRHAMLDYEEIPGSLGSSSVFMDQRGHRFLFTIGGKQGYVEILKDGWAGFKYSCRVGDEELTEATQMIAEAQGAILYDVDVPEYTFTSDWSEGEIAWYQVVVTRRSDNYTTSVHRRFRDFDELLTEVKRRLKGHHLYSSLPRLPDKRAKLITDHNDSHFLLQRSRELKVFLVSLLQFPHVPLMTCTKAFLGLMEQVRETSVVFTTPTLGMSLVPSQIPGIEAQKITVVYFPL